MATIFYSVMGEGRGHAARARAMVEHLRGNHRLVLYASFDALEFLENAYGNDPEVEVRPTQGLKFHYTEGKLDLSKTIRLGLSLWWNMPKTVNRLAVDIERERPDLVISDFEPTLARAGRQRGVPVLSLDHQHFMVAYDLSALPRRLRWWAWAMGWSIWMFGIGQQRTVISAFYQPPLKPRWANATQVGPLLRPAIRNRKPETGEHLLSYLRRSSPESLLDKLNDLGRPVKVYGLGGRDPFPRGPRQNLQFCSVDECAFVDDLVSCQGVIAAAGNQLLGESLYLGKPIFALPEKKHHEQCINATFLKEMGGGDWSHLGEATLAQLQEFIQKLPQYREQIAAIPYSFDGNQAAVAVIEQMLNPPQI